MDLLPTLPRRTWLDRASMVLAIGLVLIGAVSIAGWWLHNEALLVPFAGYAPVKHNAAAGFLVLGLVLLAIELGWPQLSWCALIPAAIGGRSRAEIVFQLHPFLEQPRV